jgi:lipopolysaccharide biosynthesis regulator YciM
VDFESWWLIFLPVLFALGWMAARFDFRHMLSETRNLPDSYFKGLNFLLNEQPDRAIDAFIEVAKLDPETTELHFALGNLFRRRGEMERAIRVHQSLLSRADLPARQREHAQHELAQDFLKAGMLDRAEELFASLKDTSFALPALRALIRIYESSHDWSKAIESVKTLGKLVDEPVPQLVHYHCELAQAALSAKPPALDRADESLQQAAKAAEVSGAKAGSAAYARIEMLGAMLCVARGDLAGQRNCLRTVLEEAPEFAGLVGQALMDNYAAAGLSAEGLNLLRGHHAQYPSLDLFNVVFREIRRQQGVDAAWSFARESLQRHPSLLGLDRLLEAELTPAKGDAGAATTSTMTTPESISGSSAVPQPGVFSGQDLGLLRRLIHRHTQRLDRYECRQCGFQARRFYWQCPGCNAWETYQPRRLEELQ